MVHGIEQYKEHCDSHSGKGQLKGKFCIYMIFKRKGMELLFYKNYISCFSLGEIISDQAAIRAAGSEIEG